MSQPLITQTRIPVYVTGAPGPKGDTGATGSGTNDNTKVLKSGDVMTGDLTNESHIVSTSPDYAGFQHIAPNQVGYSLYNQGGQAEWVLYQPASPSHEFRIATKVGAPFDDKLRIGLDGTVTAPYRIVTPTLTCSTQVYAPTVSGPTLITDDGAGSGIVYFSAPANAIYLHYSATGFAFNGNDVCIGGLKPVSDGVFPIGSAALRFNIVYAVTGAINTSDEREKEQIAPPTDALLDAWADVDWISYKWKEAVAEKGDGARLHVGLIAQHVAAVFEAHGLDGFALGLLCYDEWQETSRSTPVWVEPELDAETGEELVAGHSVEGEPVVIPAGDRYGVRYEEALALEAALARRDRARLDARLAALEGGA